MNKEEYLELLKNCLQALPLDEQEEALDFYENYLNDAEDEEKAIEELGTPEELAGKIKEKIACVPEKKTAFTQEEDSSSENSSRSAFKFSFPASTVHNWDFSLCTAEVVIVGVPAAADDSLYEIEARNIPESVLKVYVSSRGSLIIENKGAVPAFVRERTSRRNGRFDRRKAAPRILIKTPQQINLDTMKISFAAGQISIKDINAECNRLIVEHVAGDFSAGFIKTKEADLRCCSGQLKIDGEFTDKMKLNCALGNLALRQQTKTEDCAYSARVFLGSFKMGNVSKKGVGNIGNKENEAKHIDANVFMGEISIN